MVRKDKIVAEVDRVHLGLHIHNYICLNEQFSKTITTYNRLHNGLESLTQKHNIPLVGSLGETRVRDIILREVKQYIEKIKQTSKQEGLEITKDIVLQYIVLQYIVL